MIFSGLWLGTIVCGCSSDGQSDDIRYATLYDVVEYTSQNDGQTIFSLYPPEKDDPVVLTAFSSPDLGKLEPGQALMLAYTPVNGEAYVSDRIEVKGIGSVTNSQLLKGAPETLSGWDDDPVWVSSLWRAGRNVMMRVSLVYDDKPRVFRLVVDETTMDQEYPDAYLVNIRRSEGENFLRQYYVAFDLYAFWTHPQYRGIKIHVNNSNNTSLDEFIIERPFSLSSGDEEDIPGGGDSDAVKKRE
ncbi:MAG: hypothetical protein HDS68_06310 [Bacteroidales bacterium]|nr:hypothetical protein [Bacteroidales bacterium]